MVGRSFWPVQAVLTTCVLSPVSSRRRNLRARQSSEDVYFSKSGKIYPTQERSQLCGGPRGSIQHLSD